MTEIVTVLFYGARAVKILEIIFICLASVWAVAVFLKSMHMFQLNSYKNLAHIKWLLKNNILFSLGKKAKKPLVYTHRVIRMCIASAAASALICLLYTRLWVLPFKTPVFLPVILLFAGLAPIIANIINAPFEKANNNRYIRDAKRIIDSMPNLITIGVTGSYGKTSTKYYLHKLLSAKFNTLMTPESYNTTLGVVKTIRNSLRPTHEIFICEMGMKWKGDIKEICDIVKPKHAVITSIGPQHLESMKTVGNIIAEKFSITECITEGICFLNYDNEYIRQRKINRNIVKYGISDHISGDSDYKASGVSVSENGSAFTVTVGSESAYFETRLIGSHNVQNIVGAIAVAHSVGVSMNELLLPVKRLEPAEHRLQISHSNNTVIIDDSFNSNPAGAKSALEALKLFGGVRILITPGMVELGAQSHELNRTFGGQAADSCEYALLIGEKQSHPIKEGLLQAGFPPDKIRVFDSFSLGMTFANTIDTKGKKKIILIENDLPDNY